MFSIRFAKGEDALCVQKIYAPFVAYTSVTFEYEVPRPYELKRRINSICNKYPWLICEWNGQVAGYAYAHQLFSRAAYAWDAELSVYILDDFQRCNIASALYYAVIELLKKQGFCNAVARVTVPNEKSLAFHKAFGFVSAGVLHNAGYKLGEWHDVALLEKPLVEDWSCKPREIVPITAIDREEVERVFENAVKIIRPRTR